jgi:hypothetical protein
LLGIEGAAHAGAGAAGQWRWGAVGGRVRREVLDRRLILGCRGLVSVLAEDSDQDNGHRPYRAVGLAPSLGSSKQLAPCRRGGSCDEIDSVG